jgi:hypothetical protein
MSFGSTFLREPEDVIERRPVWRTALLEIAFLLALMTLVAAATRLTDFDITGTTNRRLFGLVFALAPLLLWFAISYRGEIRASERRRGMFTVLLLTALGANAVGVPVVERLFTVDVWLTNAPGFSRLIGFTLTVGLLQEFIKYLVLRYAIFPHKITERADGIAYSLAAAVGYATVLNVNLALGTPISPEAFALRITEITLTQMAVSAVIGYFLSELAISDNSLLSLPAGLMLAAFLNALIVTFRGGLIVGTLAPGATANEALRGVGGAVFFLILIFGILGFIINNADERAAMRSEEEVNGVRKRRGGNRRNSALARR